MKTEQKTIDGMNETWTLHSAALTGNQVPTRVLLAPWGSVESTHGSFLVDEEAAKLAVTAFEEHGTDLPIDYEHQTLGGSYASPDGKAPAAGWIKRLLAEPGVGLLAEIEWTQEGAKTLAAKEYRYLSPVAIIRKTDRKLVGIHSAALTNKPAIVGMEPLVNRADEPIPHDGGMALEHLRTELNLPEETDTVTILLAASRRLADLNADVRKRNVDEHVRAAMRAGKLVEAQREWAEALIARDEKLFDEWLRTSPVIVPTGRTNPPDANELGQRRRSATAAKARAEFRTHRVLSGITSEEAYVASALREPGE